MMNGKTPRLPVPASGLGHLRRNAVVVDMRPSCPLSHHHGKIHELVREISFRFRSGVRSMLAVIWSASSFATATRSGATTRVTSGSSTPQAALTHHHGKIWGDTHPHDKIWGDMGLFLFMPDGANQAWGALGCE